MTVFIPLCLILVLFKTILIVLVLCLKTGNFPVSFQRKSSYVATYRIPMIYNMNGSNLRHVCFVCFYINAWLTCIEKIISN